MKDKFHISVKEAVKKAAKEQAEKENRSLSNFIEQCIIHYLAWLKYQNDE